MPEAIVSEYVSYLQDEKGMAEPTCRGYQTAVTSLLAVARAHPRRLYLPKEWQLAHLDKRALEIYLNHLREERGWAPSTVALQASALRSFFAFLQSRGHVERNPARHLLPKLPPRNDTPPEGEEATVRRLFDLPFNNSDGSVRDYDVHPSGQKFLIRVTVGETIFASGGKK